MNPELKQAVENLTESWDDFKEKDDDRHQELVNRLDKLECKNDMPVRGPQKKVAEGGAGYRKYYTKDGPVYELDAGCKAADVLPAQTQGNKFPEVSFERWLGAIVAEDKCGDREALDYVRETKSVATTSTGVQIPEVFIPQWIDQLRAQSVLQRAGARTVAMDWKTVNYSRLTGDPTVSWHDEAGSITPSDPTFQAVSLTAKTLVCRTQVTLECSQDSPNFGEQLGMIMMKAFAAEIDRAGLHGAGSSVEPQGIYGQSGVATVAGVSVPTNYDEMVDALETLMSNNLPLSAIDKFAIMSPRTWSTYQKLKTGISSDNTPLERPPALRNLTFLPTTNVSNSLGSPADDSTIFLGDFTEVLLGIRKDPSFRILTLNTYASNLLLEIVGYARVDYMLTRPSSLLTMNAVDD